MLVTRNLHSKYNSSGSVRPFFILVEVWVYLHPLLKPWLRQQPGFRRL